MDISNFSDSSPNRAFSLPEDGEVLENEDSVFGIVLNENREPGGQVVLVVERLSAIFGGHLEADVWAALGYVEIAGCEVAEFHHGVVD